MATITNDVYLEEAKLTDGSSVYSVTVQIGCEGFVRFHCVDRNHASRIENELAKCVEVEIESI